MESINYNSFLNCNEKYNETGDCNINSCRSCNINWRKTLKEVNPQEEKNNYTMEKIRKENNFTEKIRKRKFCQKECDHCQKVILKVDEEDSWRAAQLVYKANRARIDIKLDTSEEIARKLTEYYQTLKLIKAKGDGDCFFKSVLNSCHKTTRVSIEELREICSELIIKSDIIDEQFIGEGFQDKNDYAQNVRYNGFYGGQFEMKVLAEEYKILIVVLRKINGIVTSNYFGPKNGERANSVIALKFHKNLSDNNCLGAHFDLLETDYLPKTQLIAGGPEITTWDDYNTLIWNVRSLNDYSKKIVLIELLRKHNIEVAFLQETFLKDEDSLYIQGYKIYRGNNRTVRRKGSNIDCKCIKVDDDPMGRFVKIKMVGKSQYNTITLSSIYLEPDADVDDMIMPDSVLNAKIIAGDCNKHKLNMESIDVYNLKNIKVIELVPVETKISDHGYILAKVSLPFKKKEFQTQIHIVDKIKASNNREQITEIIKSKKTPNLIDARTTKTLMNSQEYNERRYWFGLDNFDEFKDLMKQELDRKTNSAKPKENNCNNRWKHVR